MRNRVELYPQDLRSWLDGLPSSVKVISLDCFDTIVWRRVAAPHDVFFTLQSSPVWRAHGIRAYHRTQGEAAARKHIKAVQGKSEPRIEDIYRHMLPSATQSVISECVDAEMAAEKHACFMFQPLLDLVRQAVASGRRVAVFSDTYWSADQLRELMQSLHDDPVLEKLEVFTSCDAGMGKSDGVWPHYLAALGVKTGEVVHLGDNPGADVKGPSDCGVHGVLLLQHDRLTQRHVEDYAQACVQLMPSLRCEEAVPSVFRAMFAQQMDSHWPAEHQLGYRTLGPVFYAFSRFVEDRLEVIEKGAGQVARMGFLMRDGHLPGLAHSVFNGGDGNYCPIHISRFTANAASLYDTSDVARLLASVLGRKSIEPALRQMLFNSDEIRRIERQSDGQVNRIRELVMRKESVATILSRAAQMRDRLLRHVCSRTGLQRGETLVLVDLGYSGTVQNRIRDLLRKEMDVRVQGLYLLALQPGPEDTDRQGMIGLPWAEERLVSALTAHIGIFEMLCTKAEASTIDYTEDGEPVFGDGGVKEAQSSSVEQVQLACLGFIRDMRQSTERWTQHLDMAAMAMQAAGELCRMIYFPTPQEVQFLSSFEFDFNLGTDLMLQAADLESGVHEFRREGFSALNKDFTTWRVNAPMELRYMDMPLVNTLFSATRFGFDVRQSDASMRGIRFPVLIANAQQHSITHVDSFTTIDGFHVLHLPCSASFDMSILWGQVLSAVQVEAIERVPLAQHTAKDVIDASAQVVLDGSDAWTPTVQGLRVEAMLFVPRCSAEFHGSHLLRLVARPLELRSVA